MLLGNGLHILLIRRIQECSWQKSIIIIQNYYVLMWNRSLDRCKPYSMIHQFREVPATNVTSCLRNDLTIVEGNIWRLCFRRVRVWSWSRDIIWNYEISLTYNILNFIMWSKPYVIIIFILIPDLKRFFALIAALFLFTRSIGSQELITWYRSIWPSWVWRSRPGMLTLKPCSHQ